MSFLTLAQGDPIGKDLLKKLVNSRYGISPPAMESLRITYRGRTRARLWRVPLWARVDAVATYRFPREMKWEFKVRLLGLLRSGYTTSFDGTAVYEQHGFKVSTITDEVLVESARRRAWAETVFFISPLIADPQVHVEGEGNHTLRVWLAGQEADVAIVRLDEDNRLHEVEVERVDPADGQRKRQFIRPVGELVKVDGLIMPQTIQRYWEDELFMELSPVAVDLNPELAPDVFTLREENPLEGLDDTEENDST